MQEKITPIWSKNGCFGAKSSKIAQTTEAKIADFQNIILYCVTEGSYKRFVKLPD
jgi:hypothetical protein